MSIQRPVESSQTRQPKLGVDYWPDAFEPQSGGSPSYKPLSLYAQALIFVLVYALLQLGWLWLRDAPTGHWVRGDLTTRPAAALIRTISPEIPAKAIGNQIKAPGGGLVIKLGCEGVEALFILMAALVAAPLTWRSRLFGALAGAMLIYILNQGRILCLFYAYRQDKSLFYLLHGSVAPLILIAVAGVFFYLWLQRFGLQPVNPSLNANKE